MNLVPFPLIYQWTLRGPLPVGMHQAYKNASFCHWLRVPLRMYFRFRIRSTLDCAEYSIILLRLQTQEENEHIQGSRSLVLYSQPQFNRHDGSAHLPEWGSQHL
jgi:hypothetical protein